uniref:Link domain-containing protein n=1 Tax=viral metagenome TaxID=1070528 RepID=A0A6C0J5K5_9ZZZZ
MLSFVIVIILLCIILYYLISYKYYWVSQPQIPKPEVYCIGRNAYRYASTEALCKRLNSRLATKGELYKAYTKGANWCTLGWVEGLQAYSISSINTNECQAGFKGGRFPGQIKLGVVCYGIKPSYIEGKELKLNILPWNTRKWSYN